MATVASNSSLVKPARKEKTTFYSLPGELRNKIYRHALVETEPIPLTKDNLEHIRHGLQTSLARAVPGLANEITSSFYLENTFTFGQETLSDTYIDIFEDLLGDHVHELKKLGICRGYTVGNMKMPIVISFTIEIFKTNKFRIVRPADENNPFPGLPGYAKFRGQFTEPCRCEVGRLASRLTPRIPGVKLNGRDLLQFLSNYVGLIRAGATSEYFEICKKCGTVKRS